MCYASGKSEINAFHDSIRNVSTTKKFSKNMVSIKPSCAEKNVPLYVKKVQFGIKVSSTMRYSQVSGKYISTSNPTLSISHTGKVNLYISSYNCSYRDNGNTITYYFSASISGNVTSTNGVYCGMNYGTVSGSYTVGK